MIAYYSDGKRVTIEELYKLAGLSKNSVICGQCNHRGTLRKNGRYYEVVHTQAEKTTYYFGKGISTDFIFIPIRIPKKD